MEFFNPCHIELERNQLFTEKLATATHETYIENTTTEILPYTMDPKRGSSERFCLSHK